MTEDFRIIRRNGGVFGLLNKAKRSQSGLLQPNKRSNERVAPAINVCQNS